MAIAGAPRVATLVLAGGKSSRMGRDKAFLSLDGRDTFLRRVFREAAKVCDDAWVSVAPGQSLPNFPSVEDEICGKGPLGGVVSGLSFLAGRGFDGVYVLACDLPFISADIISRGLAAFASDPGKLMVAWQNAKTERLETLAAVYSSAALPLLKAAFRAGRLRLREALPDDRILRLKYGDEMEKYFYNCNTPAEYAKVLASFRGPVGVKK